MLATNWPVRKAKKALAAKVNVVATKPLRVLAAKKVQKVLAVRKMPRANAAKASAVETKVRKAPVAKKAQRAHAVKKERKALVAVTPEV